MAMDFWHKARSLAEEATKRSQELAKDAVRRSQDLTIGTSKLSDVVSETAKRSKEIAAEASKRAEQIRSEALKRADDIKLFASSARAPTEPPVGSTPLDNDLETFGVTDELREFVEGITTITFRDFPLEDDTELCDVDTVTNVRQDLSEWQTRHANLVLQTVKEISKLRYELCPRFMKERKFWRIYFILVNSHVAPFEKRYLEDVRLKSAEQEKDDTVKETMKVENVKLKSAEQEKDDTVKDHTNVENVKLKSADQEKDVAVKEPAKAEITSKTEVKEANQQSKTSMSSSTEQDLDVFLLGDPGDSDDGPDDIDGDFDDDFDKMLDGLDDEKDNL